MGAQILALIESPATELAVTESLIPSGHNVLVATSYPKAIAILQGVHIDLIISDVHLENGGNVFDFLKWVRTNPLVGAMPFVLLSCEPTILAMYLEDGIKTSARMLGATKYIRMNKFDGQILREQIDPLLPNNIRNDVEIKTAIFKDRWVI